MVNSTHSTARETGGALAHDGRACQHHLVQGIPGQQVPYKIAVPSFTLDMDNEVITDLVVPTTPLPVSVRLTRLRRLEP